MPAALEIGPHAGQVLLGDAQHVDALAAGDLHRRDLVLVDDVGDGAQFAWRWSWPPHMRGTTE